MSSSSPPPTDPRRRRGAAPDRGRGGAAPAGSRGPARSGEPRGIGAVLSELLAGRPWDTGVRLGELARGWDVVVGERLASECSPASLANGVLVVRATSAAWGAQVRFLAGAVRDRANEVLGPGAVREVRVVIHEDP